MFCLVIEMTKWMNITILILWIEQCFWYVQCITNFNYFIINVFIKVINIRFLNFT